MGKLFPSVDFDKEEGTFQWGCGTSSHIRFFHLRALLEESALQQEFRELEVNLLLSGIYGEGFLPILQKGLVNYHLLLSPYKWSVEGRCLAMRTMSDDGSYAIETYPLKYVHRESMVVHGAPSLFELSDRFYGGDVVRAGKTELELFPLLSPKKALITLLEQARRKQLSLCGVYGLNQHVIKGEKGAIACRLVTSIAQSGMLARRNVAILFLNDFPLEDWNQLIDQLSLPSSVNLRAVSINNLKDVDVYQLSRRYDESKPCLLLVNTGPVSDAFFKGIIQCAELFVTEGANSVSQSIKYNKPYLSPISQDSYSVRNYRYLTELPDSRPGVCQHSCRPNSSRFLKLIS
ncbi:hypothetical protein GCM10023116_19290 [Kistimonas scapharcae]|uniref:Uncharacterized protein n=1 Tax=Kistimonas scapharcae TaxID=1036133 RepID=A0ABP8V1K3_9GAMM